jgi:hypothetical protein
MYILNVSHDCGLSYCPLMQSDCLDDFTAKCAKLDGDWLRWYIVDEKGEFVDSCLIHKKILSFIGRVRKR